MSVSIERFTSNANPCPICGFHDRGDRERGTRCGGYRGTDPRYVYCTNVGGTGIDRDPDSGAYRHYMTGACRCGTEHGAAVAITRPSLKTIPGGKPQERRVIDRTYDYTDETGTLLYQVVRYTPKNFSQRRPEPGAKNGWAWSLGECRRVLYHLPEITASAKDNRRVFVVEGEKDADALRALGFVATCNAMGAGKWRKEYTDALKGRHVAILPDNDDVGRDHALFIARSLQGVAASVRVVMLHGLDKHGDVSDWLKQGHTAEELQQLTKDTAPYVSNDSKTDEPPSSSGKYMLNDAGNARRLVDLFGEDIRYVAEWGWLVWNGKHWIKDKDGTVTRLAKKVIGHIYRDAAEVHEGGNGDLAKTISQHAAKSGNHNHIVGMVAEAQDDTRVRLQTSDFDRNPFLFNCQNGTVNLRTGEVAPHTRTDLLTKMSGVSFDASAQCPHWIAFLEEIMESEQKNKDEGKRQLITFLQRAVGYSLTGDTSEQCFFLLHGSTGNNGKSTFINVLRALIGQYGTVAQFDAFLEKRNESGPRNDLAGLEGARFVSASESQKGRKLDGSIIKQLTGQDAIKARFLYKDEFTFTPTFKIWLAANHKPILTEQGNPMRRRVKLVPFKVTVMQPDKHLATKLEAELPGILNWAIQGCKDWFKEESLADPPDVSGATDAYMAESDPIRDFLNEHCTTGTADTHKCLFPDLYKSYVNWCSDENEQALRKGSFKSSLEERGLVVRYSTGNKLYAFGLSLTAPIEQSEKSARFSYRHEPEEPKEEYGEMPF